MGTTRVSRAAVGVVVLLLAGVLAGCDDEDPPKPQGPIESSSEPTSSLTSAMSDPTPTAPVAPTLPAEATEENQAGAEAFVEYYWKVVNYATKSGNVRPLRDLDQPSCDGCESGVQGIASVYRRGGRIVGGDYEVVRLEPIQSASGHWTVVAHTKVGRQRAVGAGDLNREYPAGRDKWLIALARVRGAWSVSTLESV